MPATSTGTQRDHGRAAGSRVSRWNAGQRWRSSQVRATPRYACTSTRPTSARPANDNAYRHEPQDGEHRELAPPLHAARPRSCCRYPSAVVHGSLRLLVPPRLRASTGRAGRGPPHRGAVDEPSFVSLNLFRRCPLTSSGGETTGQGCLSCSPAGGWSEGLRLLACTTR